MALKERKMDEIPQELKELFDGMENDVKDFTYCLKSVADVRDFDFDGAFNEMLEKLEEIDCCEKEKTRLMAENDTVLRGIAKCDTVLSSNEESVAKLESEIQRLEKRVREDSYVARKIRDALDLFGVRLEIVKAENIDTQPITGSFIVKFSKVNPRCMDKWYKFFIDVRYNNITVTKTEPSDLLSESEIQSVTSSTDTESFLRKFVTLCRTLLVEKFATHANIN